MQRWYTWQAAMRERLYVAIWVTMESSIVGPSRCLNDFRVNGVAQVSLQRQ
jgi:hypothetical protein